MIDEALNKKLAGLVTSIGELKRNTASLGEQNKVLVAENKALSERLSTLEAYSRSDNLIIRGLPEKFVGINCITLIQPSWWCNTAGEPSVSRGGGEELMP